MIIMIDKNLIITHPCHRDTPHSILCLLTNKDLQYKSATQGYGAMKHFSLVHKKINTNFEVIAPAKLVAFRLSKI
jgi:hypothetical protein